MQRIWGVDIVAPYIYIYPLIDIYIVTHLLAGKHREASVLINGHTYKHMLLLFRYGYQAPFAGLTI